MKNIDQSENTLAANNKVFFEKTNVCMTIYHI